MIYRRTPSSPSSDEDKADNTATETRWSLDGVSPPQGRRVGIAKAHSLMLGPLLIAAALSAAHHILLSNLDETYVQDFLIPQTWVRDIGNALAWVVQFLLQVSVGIVLTQSIWTYVRKTHLTLNDLDTLFSLPSFSSLPSSFFRRDVISVLLLSAVVEALSLVGIFAPNALSVVPAGSPVNTTVWVAVPALDGITTDKSSNLATDDAGLLYYVGPSATFQNLTRDVLDSGTVLSPGPPLGCGEGCTYSIEYWAPALKCAGIPQSSMAILNTNFTALNGINATLNTSTHVSNPTHFLEGAYVYNATTSFGYTVNRTLSLANSTNSSTPLLQSSPYGKPFTLDVVYATNSFTLPFTMDHPINYNLTGYSCTFHNATYTASFSWSNATLANSARVKEFGAQLGPLTDPGGLNASFVDSITASFGLGGLPRDYGTYGEFLSTYSALALADALSQYFYGTIAFSPQSAEDVGPTYTSRVLNTVLTGRTSFVGGGDKSSESLNTLSLDFVSTSYDDLGRLMEDACANLTASLVSISQMDDLPGWVEVPVIIIPNSTAYAYQASRLWGAYGTALAITLLAVVYGLVCIFHNGGAMERSFSSIASSVRDRELDTLLGEPEESLPARAQKVKLRYGTGITEEGGRAGFRIATWQGARNGMEMSETTTLAPEIPLERH